MMLLELNAAVGSNLNDNLNKVFTETQIDYVQQRSNLLEICRTMGLNTSVLAKRASCTLLDISLVIPVLGDKPDQNYYPVLQSGSQFTGGGKTFEITDSVDFSSQYSNLGVSNRSIVPNLDSNGIVQSYTITKREVVVNGSTNIFKRVISEQDVIPFFEVVLPDNDVISVDSVILMPGTNYSSNPTLSDFNNPENKFYQVDYLAQQSVFVEEYNNTNVDIKSGNWVETTRKFLVEYTDNSFCSIVFGSGNNQDDIFKSGMIKAGITNQEFLNNYLQNTALGEMLKSGYTLFVKYRTGGGSSSNLGANTIIFHINRIKQKSHDIYIMAF